MGSDKVYEKCFNNYPVSVYLRVSISRCVLTSAYHHFSNDVRLWKLVFIGNVKLMIMLKQK